jgi:hypothetical protein
VALEQLNDIGVRITEAVAGFAGGVAYVFVTKNTKPFEAIGCVLVGTFTANYLSGYVTGLTSYLGPAALGPGPSGFVTGLCAMAICQGIIAGVRRSKAGGEEK